MFLAASLLAVALFGLSPLAARAQVNFTGTPPVTLGSGFSFPGGVAADAAGDVFVGDTWNNEVKEMVAVNGSIPANPTINTLGSGFNHPIGVAVDAAGDVFVADSGNNAVKEIVAVNGSIPTTNPTINVLGSGFSQPEGVAVDAAGDVFVADTSNGAVKEMVAVNGRIPPNPAIKVLLFTLSTLPYDVAVDAAGDVFVADYGNNDVKEMVAVNGSIPANPTINILGSGFSYPTGVAVDAAGDVFVADYGNNAVKEMVAVNGSIPANPTINVLGSGFFNPTGVAVDAAGEVFVADQSHSAVKEIQAGSVNFVTANVCPAGQTTPAPCSQTLTLNFDVAAGTTIGSVKFFTLGAVNLDFQAEANDISTTLCSAQTYSSATICTVDVTFAPLAPGQRLGAVQVLDGNGNVLASTDIYGTGMGPAIAFSPSNIATLGSGFDQPTGAAVDAAGDVFVADTDHSLVKEIVAVNGSIPANPTINLLGSGFYDPIGVAMDAAGDVFVADFGNSAVKEILAAGGYTTVLTLGSGFYYPHGVAVDAHGDVFVADFGNNAVKEILAAGGYTTVLTLGSGFFDPTGVAVDAAGDVFVADYGHSEVKEILAVNGSIPANPTINTLGSGFSHLTGVAVDAAGDVFVADYKNNAVKEILAVNGSIPTNPTILILGSGFNEPEGVAVDGAGDVFVADEDNNAVKEITRSQPPSLSFATTNVGSTSSDSPQSVQFQNIGNAPLVATSLGMPENFDQVAGPGTPEDCAASGFTLDPGAECNVSIDFTPQVPGAFSFRAYLVDNALNGNPAIQDVWMSGTGTGLASTTTALASSANPSSYGESVTFRATVTATSGPTPTGTVNFYHLTTLLGSGTLSGGVATFITSLSVGTTHIHAVYVGNSDDAGSTSATIAQVVLYSTATALTSTPNPSTVGEAVTFKATVTATSGATPTGTVNLYHLTTLLGSGTLSGGVATFTTSTLQAGATSHIHAVYVGSSTDETSTSAVVGQTVLYSTTTTLTSTPNPSTPGQKVTFTATVKAASGSTPTGTVSFYHFATLLGSGTLSGGVATFTTSTLPVATSHIHAVYVGDSTDATSTSATIAQVVNP
jgi:sugar lactone lactonase YvrE